jgi:hypothetical protein
MLEELFSSVSLHSEEFPLFYAPSDKAETTLAQRLSCLAEFVYWELSAVYVPPDHSVENLKNSPAYQEWMLEMLLAVAASEGHLPDESEDIIALREFFDLMAGIFLQVKH